MTIWGKKELSIDVIQTGITRMTKLLGKPRFIDVGEWAVEIRQRTAGWEQVEFEAAVEAVIGQEKYFPKPAVFLAARPQKARAAPAHRPARPEHDVRCKVCQIEPFAAGYEMPGSGVIHGRIRCYCRRGEAGWYTPEALAYVDSEVPAPADYVKRMKSMEAGW